MTRVEFLFKNLKKGKILDIGNLGSQANIHKELIDVFGEQQVYGLDIEDQTKNGFSFINQKIGTVEQLSFSDNFFDTVYMGEVLEHSWEPKKSVEECFRVLKPEGVIIVDTPNVYSLSRMLRYCIKGEDVILGDPDHKIFYSRAMLENIVLATGFKMVEIISDRKCTIKGRNLTLFNFRPFLFLGEHLLFVAKK